MFHTAQIYGQTHPHRNTKGELLRDEDFPPNPVIHLGKYSSSDEAHIWI